MSHAGVWQALVASSNANKAKAVLLLTVAIVLVASLLWGRDATRSSYVAVEVFGDSYAPIIYLIGAPLGERGQSALMHGFSMFIDLLHRLGMGIGVLGFAILFWGYVFHLLLVMLPGAVIGGALGSRVSPDSDSLPSIIGVVVGSTLGGWLMLAIYALGVFILGFGIGYLLAAQASGQVDPSLVTVAAGIVGGTVMLVAERFLSLLYTSMTGAIFVASGFGLAHPAVMVSLVVAGMFVQYHLRKRFWRRSRKTKRASAVQAVVEPPRAEPVITPEPSQWRFLDELMKEPGDNPPPQHGKPSM
jgi:hypothetical protein